MAGELTPEKSFQDLKDNTVKAISGYFPFEGRHQRLELQKVWVEDDLPIDDIKSQAHARLHDKTWSVPIKAHVNLVDKKTGQVVDKREITLARIPKLTSRYGYIVDGNEYHIDHLFRLKSGVYARVQNNGDLEAEFNLVRGPAGHSFSVALDREKKRFNLIQGDSHIPLYPVLKALGVSDDQLTHEWGEKVLAANKPKKDEAILKALDKFFKKTAEDGEPQPKNLGEYAQYVNKFYDQTVIRPDSTKITLGKPFEKVNGEVLSIAANKILGISRGTHQPDDRDSLAFKEIVAAEDFLPEKLERSARVIRGKIRNNIDTKKNIAEILQVGEGSVFNRPIREFFTKGGSLTERSEQTNPITILSSHRKTTLLAPDMGGIKSDQSITNEMRVINPSHFGFLDPMHTPEGERTGITVALSLAARKNGRNLEIPVYNLKSGKTEYVNATHFHSSSAILPDQVKWENGKPRPLSSLVNVKLSGGDIEKRSPSEAQYVMLSGKGVFGVASNLIPFLPADQGNRASMADKQMEQAISLKHREAPLVQTKTDSKDPNVTFEKVLGHFTAIRSPVAGKVLEVKNDEIIVTDGKKKHSVHLYDHFPLNDPKAMMHSTPLVKPGDTVRQGQLVADSNFTRHGTLAMGTNLHVGYMPYKGYNFEDGIVISESAAKKLTSEHLHTREMEIDPDSDVVSLKTFKAYAGWRSSNLTREQLDHLGEDGVIKPGARVTPGSVLIAAVGKNIGSKQGDVLAALGKRAISPYKDKSVVWDEDHVGTVVRVVRDPSGKKIKIHVRTEEPMVVGDKLSGRHGNKGIVTNILPDHEMPFVAQPNGEKKHLDVLLNPSGIPTRINPSQVLETAAAKIADKTGKPYIVDNFSGPDQNYQKQVTEDLAKHGLSAEEHVYDPMDPKKPLGSVLVGKQYLFKLKHQVEKKLAVRGGGAGLTYDADKQPDRGNNPGQGFGALEVYAILGHNARHNLREMATYKSDMQGADFWNLIHEGYEPPPPKVPFAYEKFVGMLKGLGVNVSKNGTKVQILPTTDKHIIEMAGGPKGEITHGHLVLRAKDLREEKGGLFDPIATGGIKGTKWSYIRLSEPMPNPIFMGAGNKPGPIPVLLGMRLQDAEKVVKGELSLEGKTGGVALEEALKRINVDHEISALKGELPKLREADLDRANRKLKYLLALKEANLKPHEAYLLRVLPVLPPSFRPVSVMHNGDVQYTSFNGLYKNIAILNNKLGQFDPKTFSDQHRHPLRWQLYDGLKALQSVGKYSGGYDLDSPGGKRKLKGILDTIGGGDDEQPKEGFFQSKLVKRRQDLSIRSTIVPEPSLGLDEVGIPKGAALELYKPFVVAELKRAGYTPLEGINQVKAGTPVAIQALERVVKDRPLLLKRDPALHKFSVMAFKPILVEGKAIKIHPLVTGGFNADFDGDTMAGTVPVSREAIEEAKKMFPSANLFSPTHFGVMYKPNQEMMLGLHLLTRWGKQTGKTYDSVDAVKKDFKDGVLKADDVISVKGAKAETTAGRLTIASVLPGGFGMNNDILHNPNFEITKKTIGGLVGTLAKGHSKDFPTVINKLKDLGNDHSFRVGYSIGLKDFAPLPGRDKILEEAHAEAAKARAAIKDKAKLDDALVDIYQKATERLDKAAEEHHKATGRQNRLMTMVISGARGTPEQLRQMIAAPMLMQDSTGRTLPMPVTRSYAEGLDIAGYWLAQHGARKGTLQRAQGTSEPGVVTKDIMNTSMSTLIVSSDCKTTQGVSMPLDHDDVADRFTAQAVKLKDGSTIPAGTLLTPEIISRLRNSLGPNKDIQVRSPLKCQHGDGICAKCFGVGEHGKTHEVGINIGVLAGQSMGEPATQMAMDAFHAGGVAAGRGAVSMDRITRLKQVLEMPKKLKDSATLAKLEGKVSAIRKDEVGGVDVIIGNERHYIPKPPNREIDLKVSVGDQVSRGQPLSGGPINPHHLLPLTNINKVQSYLTDELYNGLYKKEGVRQRNIEVVVRALTNLTKVVDPGDSHYAHGDVVARTVLDEHNRSLPAGKKPVVHEPMIRGIETVPNLGKDWMARLNYRELQSTIMQAAAQGLQSDLHSSHPIPGLAFGKEFGRPPAEKGKHYY